eukprot:10168722-Lingulodinium_polyedra.AAC.1
MVVRCLSRTCCLTRSTFAWSSLKRAGGRETRTHRCACPPQLRARTAKADQQRAMRRSVWPGLRPGTT